MNRQRFFACCLGLLLLCPAHTGAAQEKIQRDVSTYVNGGYYELHIIERGTDKFGKTLGKVREFIWEHWSRKRKAHITVRDCAMNYEGCNDSSTNIFYIEPDAKGAWQITMEWDFVHAAFPPITMEDEHRKGVVIYSKVEQIRTENGYDYCSESLGESISLYKEAHKLRLIGSSQEDGKSHQRCLII